MRLRGFACLASLSLAAACGDDAVSPPETLDPDTAPRAEVDRFSEAAGTLMVRTADNGLPAADEPIDFDSGAPFITRGLGPDGEEIRYYNFDVQPTAPAPIFVLFREGEAEPVSGQLNIVGVKPGDPAYNDLWQVTKVTVPADYVANELTSVAAIQAAGYPIETTSTLVNCPVVPEGSTASLRLGGGYSSLTRGWYQDQVIHYFDFSEHPLSATGGGEVPVSPIYVTFNVNPGEDGGGPPSGFVTEPGTDQTHNVVAALPEQPGYSPLWSVDIYDNAEFAAVGDLTTAQAATILAEDAALVNCPVVDVAP